MILSATPRVTEIDTILHTERTRRGGKKVTYEEELPALPDGTMIEIDGRAYLLWNRQLLTWSFSGYSQNHTPQLSSQRVRVLTPASIVQMFRFGFRPEVHETAYGNDTTRTQAP